jgi:hypothetical protein
MTRFNILLITLLSTTSWAQKSQQSKDHQDLVWRTNLPYALEDFFKQEKISSKFELNKDLNPFYLRGDFDGDHQMDYALAIVEIKTKKKGMLIYHPATQKDFLLGAGKMIPGGYNRDDMDWMDAWKIYDKKEVEQGVGETKKLKLKGEAILAFKLESSSGIIYWDGKEYRWYQQGD